MSTTCAVAADTKLETPEGPLTIKTVGASPTSVMTRTDDGRVRFAMSSDVRKFADAQPVLRITLENGRVQQTNFDKFPLVRMNESPVIDIVLDNSTEKPGGIGEPATAVVVPAIANAVATLTGKRVRKLPMTAEAIKAA